MAQHGADGPCLSDAADASVAGKDRQRHRSDLALPLAIYVSLGARDGAPDDRPHAQAQPARSQFDDDVEPATGRLPSRTRVSGGAVYVEVSAAIRAGGKAFRPESLERRPSEMA